MKSILIAEGDDRVAALFADIFIRDGWTVATCLDGQRAADALRGSAPLRRCSSVIDWMA